MTHDEIMALEGRKLDAAVAENVFGWTNVQITAFALAIGKPNPQDTAPFDAYCPRVVPRYSTDIAAAWQVVEWMLRHGWHLDLASLTANGQEWKARWEQGDVAHLHYGTAPEAICKAALLAMHVQHGKNGGKEA